MPRDCARDIPNEEMESINNMMSRRRFMTLFLCIDACAGDLLQRGVIFYVFLRFFVGVSDFLFAINIR